VIKLNDVKMSRPDETVIFTARISKKSMEFIKHNHISPRKLVESAVAQLREEGGCMANVVNVDFKPAKDIPKAIRDAKGIRETDFVEIRIENSAPNIIVEKVKSPSKKIREVFKRDGVHITL